LYADDTNILVVDKEEEALQHKICYATIRIMILQKWSYTKYW